MILTWRFFVEKKGHPDIYTNRRQRQETGQVTIPPLAVKHGKNAPIYVPEATNG